jgi:hypothetical protein
MRYASAAFITVLLASSALGQVPDTSQSTSLLEGLQQLPAMVANHPVDPLAFSKMLDSHLNDSATEVEAALPLLKQYLQSPNIEIRRNSLLTVFVLARRPNSASELSSVLPALYSHLAEQDIYLRQGTLAAITALQPQPPPDALASLTNALVQVKSSDRFGAALAATIARFNPNSDETQSAVLNYLHRPDLTDSARADVIDEIASPTLGDRVTQDVIDVVTTAPSGRLRNASIDACAKIGPRAVNQIKTVLDAIQASNSETAEARTAANKALAVIKPR